MQYILGQAVKFVDKRLTASSQLSFED